MLEFLSIASAAKTGLDHFAGLSSAYIKLQKYSDIARDAKPGEDQEMRAFQTAMGLGAADVLASGSSAIGGAAANAVSGSAASTIRMVRNMGMPGGFN